MATEWFYTHAGQNLGPVSSQKLKELAEAGQLQPNDYVWKEGMSDWVLASNIKGLFVQPAAPQRPPLPPQFQPPPVQAPQTVIPQAAPVITTHEFRVGPAQRAVETTKHSFGGGFGGMLGGTLGCFLGFVIISMVLVGGCVTLLVIGSSAARHSQRESDAQPRGALAPNLPAPPE